MPIKCKLDIADIFGPLNLHFLGLPIGIFSPYVHANWANPKRCMALSLQLQISQIIVTIPAALLPKFKFPLGSPDQSIWPLVQ